MKEFVNAGVGMALIGLAFSIRYVEFLGIDFSSFPTLTLVVIQIGMVIAGLGLMVGDDV